MTSQLPTFSRRQVAHTTTLDLNDVVERFEPILRKFFKADITISTAFDGRVCPVEADRGRIEQVLLNLADNARDAMPEGGVLSFRTRSESLGDEGLNGYLGLEPGDYVVLSVRDTGAGMDTETRRRAFEPFFITKPADGGTGLGLSSAYGIVQQHGGTIALFSAPGHGSTFEIWLPRVEALPPDDEITEAPAPRRKGTLLIADDEEGVRRMLTTVLEREDFTVLQARDGLEAVKVGRENAEDIDAMVTDWIMPGLRGPAAAERLQETIPDLPVLFISGYTDEAAGVTDHGIPRERFLAKPFTRDEFLTRVDALLSDIHGDPGGA